jgi:hypothetical protein
LLERVRRDRVPYDVWVRPGLISAPPGNVIDYGYIEAEMMAKAGATHVVVMARADE